MPNEKNKLDILRHSCAHVLAAAVLEMFPEAKFGIGPTIEDGFYYDFDLPRTLIPEDLSLIEEKMKKIISKNYSFEKQEIEIDKVKDLFNKAGQKYKIELIEDLKKKGEKKVTVYQSGNFVDLCRGPHLDSTGEINPKALKLTKISGAYWRGDEKRPMLQRIYGIAFDTPKELRKYLAMLEEAEKRDHRKLGKDLELFTFSELVGAGLPLYKPRGVVVIEELKIFVESINKKYGFKKVMTPHIAKPKLYELSGHAKKFSKELFRVTSERGHEFVLNPVLCPHQTQIYSSKSRSYRDLPIRYMESDKQYRAEKPGEIGGLNRVYAITIEDGHSFCTIDQVKEEVKNMINIIEKFYQPLGLLKESKIYLSVRDPKEPDKYIGELSDWEKAEAMLQEISDELKLNAIKEEGEAALYGPKIDYKFKDIMGKEIQIPTVQLDFATPQRFKLKYIDKDGKEKMPVMVHRAILGSYERMMALLLEQFAGAFPLWLSPVQVGIIPVSDKFNNDAQKINIKLNNEDIRTEFDGRTESVGKKISDSIKQKIPYTIVIGEKEIKSKKIPIRTRDKKEIKEMNIDDFIKKVKENISKKKINL